MNRLITMFTAFSLLSCAHALANCPQAPIETLALDTTERLYQLEDAVDSCTDLNTLKSLINELIKQKRYDQTKNYLAMANDYIETSADKSALYELNAHLYLSQGNICQVHKLLSQEKNTNELLQAKKRIDISLSEYIQQKGISSSSLSCMLSASRSIASHRGLKRTKSINMAIAFKTNSAELTEAGFEQVNQLHQAIQKLKLVKYKVNFVGHTDIRGTEDYNLKLSRKRAQSVYQSIIRYDPSLQPSLSFSGKGESQPKIKANTDIAHKINRRVEVYLTKMEP